MAMREKPEDSVEAVVVAQVREDGGLDPGDDRGDGENWGSFGARVDRTCCRIDWVVGAGGAGAGKAQ